MAALQDGFRTLVTFELDPNIQLWEKRVTPFGFDGGGGINTDTMHNVALRTMHPKSLTKVTDLVMTCAYNPIVYVDYFAISLTIQEVVTTYPNGDELAVQAWPDKFIPNEHVEGEQPTAAVTVIAANTDGPPNFGEVTVIHTLPP